MGAFIRHNPENHYLTFEGDPAYRTQLQQIVLFDILINNADRKSGHVLLQEAEPADGRNRLWTIDHGICFHSDPKLRTVIWEFAGEPIPDDLRQALTVLQGSLAVNDGGLRTELGSLLSPAEIAALQKRLQHLIAAGKFSYPGPGRHYPCPPV